MNNFYFFLIKKKWEELNIILLSSAMDSSKDKIRDHAFFKRFFLNIISQYRTFGTCWTVGRFLFHQAAQFEPGLQSNPLHVEDLKT